MAEFNYAALDADEGAESHDEVGEAHTVTPSSTPRRSSPKTEEERLADAAAKADAALKKLESLQQKFIARRSAQREAFVEDLFRRFEIAEFESDLSESKRLAALSAKLNV